MQRMRGVLGLRQAGRQHFGQVAELGFHVLLRLQAPWADDNRAVAPLSSASSASSAVCAASSSACACDSLEWSVFSSSHSSAPGASLSTSPICQARRSRSRCSESCAVRASASAFCAVHAIGARAAGALCRAGAGVGIEQVAHGIGPGEALPGVLAVDVDQAFAQLAQLGGGGRAAVDPRAALALAVDAAAQQQRVAGVETGFFEPRRQRRRAGRIRR
jgi:hypothetical protein